MEETRKQRRMSSEVHASCKKLIWTSGNDLPIFIQIISNFLIFSLHFVHKRKSSGVILLNEKKFFTSCSAQKQCCNIIKPQISIVKSYCDVGQ